MVWPVDPARFVAFVGVSTTMSLAPGPAVLFCIAAGARGGVSAVAGGVAGISLAGLVWFGGAGLGLGVLMTAAPWVFRPLGLLGLAYLLWLGGSAVVRGLRGRAVEGASPGDPGARAPGEAWRDVGRGFVVQITNPKTLLYFTAVLPPFLDARRPLAGQLALIGAAALAIDAAVLGAYGLGGAALAARLREPRNAQAFSVVSGLLLMGAGALIALRL